MSRSASALIRAWMPAVAYMVLIWTLSSFPLQVPVASVPFRDKGIHFVEYGVLAVLLSYAALGTWSAAPPLRRAAATALGTIVWGMLDEIHQAYVPGRMADIVDVWADALGAVVGSALFFLVHELIRRRRAT